MKQSAARSFQPLLAGVFVLVLGVAATGCRRPRSDEDIAKQLIEKAATSPATIKWVTAKVFAKQGDVRGVYVELDAQNAFGAVIRSRECVTFRRQGDAVGHSDESIGECNPDDLEALVPVALARAATMPDPVTGKTSEKHSTGVDLASPPKSIELPSDEQVLRDTRPEIVRLARMAGYPADPKKYRITKEVDPYEKDECNATVHVNKSWFQVTAVYRRTGDFWKLKGIAR